MRETSEAYNRLHQLARDQLGEFRRYAAMTIRDIAMEAPETITRLVQACQEIELGVVKVERYDATGYSVSVIYVLPDDLFAYLQREDLPPALHELLHGGRIVPDAPTSVRDLS